MHLVDCIEGMGVGWSIKRPIHECTCSFLKRKYRLFCGFISWFLLWWFKSDGCIAYIIKLRSLKLLVDCIEGMVLDEA